MKPDVRQYLAEIGRRGGKRSRRTLTPQQARSMVRIREARRAYRRFHTSCFWSFHPDYEVGADDLPWLIDRLRTHGGRDGWLAADKLCR